MVTEESTKETVKTIAQGMPVDPAEPVVTAACFFVAGGPWVRLSPGIPCALVMSRDKVFASTRGEQHRLRA
jgi:hypothetical protein